MEDSQFFIITNVFNVQLIVHYVVKVTKMKFKQSILISGILIFHIHPTIDSNNLMATLIENWESSSIANLKNALENYKQIQIYTVLLLITMTHQIYQQQNPKQKYSNNPISLQMICFLRIVFKSLKQPNSIVPSLNFHYTNKSTRKQLKMIVIKIIGNKPQTVIINNQPYKLNFQLTHLFQDVNYFNLQVRNLELEIYGKVIIMCLITYYSYTTIKFDKTISFINFKKVLLNGFILTPFEIDNQKQIIFLSAFISKISHSDLVYSAYISNQKQQIIIKNSNDVFI